MFLLSIALIFLGGLIFSRVVAALRLPPLLGMLVAGIVLGPYALNLIDGSILSLSSDLRQIALVIIVLRAGLSLDITDLKKIGRPAAFMCFVPACFEICAMVAFAPLLFGMTYAEAALTGTVVAAVSPAVIIPKMIMMQEKGLGTEKGIPQMIMAGASVDDVFVIVLFTAFSSLFVLVGASVDVSYAVRSLGLILVLIICGLAFRCVGVLCCLIKTKLNVKERLFCEVACTPKATVQAAIGGVPLAMGLACGETVLAIAVVSIFFTAPLGAFAIDMIIRRTRLFKKGCRRKTECDETNEEVVIADYADSVIAKNVNTKCTDRDEKVPGNESADTDAKEDDKSLL